MGRTGTARRRPGDGRYFGIGFAVSFAFIFIAFVLIHIWPFGDGIVLIIDSLHQYLPFYTELHEKLTTGQSLLYDFSAGTGYDFWATLAYYMASPLNLLLVFVPTPNVADFMDLIIAVKIGLTGGIFSWYLHRRNRESGILPIVFGAMFALSNFMIGYYFNLMWLDSVAVVPLIMAGIERIVRGESGRMYGIALFYGIWCNYYIGFMLCLFSVLYYFASVLAEQQINVRQLVGRSVRYAWYSILAGGMCAVLLFPVYASLSNSESMQSNKFPDYFDFYTNFRDIVIAHFPSEHPINISDTQVGLNVYCGIIVLILLILYILDGSLYIWEKIGKLALAGILMTSFSVNKLNYIWHGLHRQNGLPNRFAFLYICIILVMSYDVLLNFRKLEWWKILVAGVIPTVFAAVMIYQERTDWEWASWLCWITPALLALYTVVLLLLRKVQISQVAAFAVIGGIILAEVGVHSIMGVQYNDNVTRSLYVKDQESYKNLTAELGETGFYRSEIDSQMMRNAIMYDGGNGIVMFNSTMLASVTEFYDRIGMEARINKCGYIGLTKLMNDVMGIKYVFSKNGKGDALYQFEKVGTDGRMTVYKNENALSLGFMVNSEILNWSTQSGNPLEVQNSFVQLATGLEGIFRLDRTIEGMDNETYDILVPEDKQVYVYTPSQVDELTVNTPEYEKSYKTYTDHCYVVNALGEDRIAHLTVDLKDSQTEEPFYIYTCANSAYEEVRETLAQNQMTEVTVNGNDVSGTVHADKDGVLLLTIPYDKNWQISVDGVRTEAKKIGGMLTGLELTAGDHEISMTYIPGGFYKGLAISAASLLLLIGTQIIATLRRKKIRQDGDQDGNQN